MDETVWWIGSERTARCSQNDPAYGVGGGSSIVTAGKALKDGVVLAIDRQQYRTGISGGPHEDPSSHDEGLFVGKKHSLACGDCRHGGSQPR